MSAHSCPETCRHTRAFLLSTVSAASPAEVARTQCPDRRAASESQHCYPGRDRKEGLFFRKRPGAHACPQCSAESVACFAPHLTVGPSLRPPPWSCFLGPSWRVLHATLRVPPAELGHGSCRAGLSLPRNHQICAASSFSFPPPPPLFHLQDKQT